MRLSHTVLTVGIVVATTLPLAGTASARETTVTGRITATDYSTASPTLVTLDPASGSVTGTFAQGAEDGVLAPKGAEVAYIHRDDTCLPQPEGCMYARDLVVAEADGTGQRVLVEGVQPETGEAPEVARPDWSPDGKRIVYDSPRGLEWIKADGTGHEVLTSTGLYGTFSPDGKSIAFLRSTRYETGDGWEYGTDVWVMDTATRQVRQLTTGHDVSSTPVDWSPDGQRIVHATDYGLRVLDVTTGTGTDLQSGWPSPLSGVQAPVFSPDGTRIAFSATDEFTYTHGTYVVDAADGGNLQVLTDRPVRLTDWLDR
ncbi:hypothetical protein [Streptomyces sp. NPDC057877]|uniref:hypothetical protein n=1 Tax=Streptomyces sp. NPDC057877 TaxID=3346269 RepID=UPI00367FE1E3